MNQNSKVKINQLGSGVLGLDEILGGGFPDSRSTSSQAHHRMWKDNVGPSIRLQECHRYREAGTLLYGSW